MPETYSNWMLKLERAEKFAAKMVKRLCDEEGAECIFLQAPVRPSLTAMGFELEIESEAKRWGTVILPLQESQWKTLQDQLSFALRWERENSEKTAVAAVG